MKNKFIRESLSIATIALLASAGLIGIASAKEVENEVRHEAELRGRGTESVEVRGRDAEVAAGLEVEHEHNEGIHNHRRRGR
ncbi:hypothetical protein HYT00_01005 [Candidatus Giovannonibacteria bacterium]|nr:hypothetical protein [Candidatus Giovannonibacteria bacterium]